MTTLEMVLLVVAAVSVIICTGLIISNIRQKKKISALTSSINDFIEKGILTQFSVSDNHFANLQNSVADLENIIRLEKSNTLIETKKNTEFISDISHQLKTPLAGLRLYCEMDYSDNPTEYTKKELQLIERMENLIQRLLRLEKIKSDSYVMDFKVWEVRDIVREMMSEFYHLFPDKKYSIVGSSELRCDKSWLSEAIGNVVKNASEHTPADGIVTVKIENSHHSTIIEINDNGGGMDEKDIPNLFTRFFSTGNPAPGSVGIGLAITKAIVEKHHGIINAENKNDGLSVIMCFPHIDGYITI